MWKPLYINMSQSPESRGTRKIYIAEFSEYKLTCNFYTSMSRDILFVSLQLELRLYHLLIKSKIKKRVSVNDYVFIGESHSDKQTFNYLVLLQR